MRNLFLVGLIGLGIVLTGATRSGQTSLGKTSKQVLVISIDSLRPDFYLSEDFEAPTLKALVKKGVSATGVQSVFPTVTYPNHTSMVTGVPPSKHGILSNTVFDWEKGPQPDWFWFTKSIKVPTLWDVAADAGLSTALVMWPVSVEAKVNWNVPEIFANSDKPQDHWDLFLKYMDKKLLSDILAGSEEKQFLDSPARDRFITMSTLHIMKTYHPNLMMSHLANVDHEQHNVGRDDALVKAAVKTADSQIAQMLEQVDLTSSFVFIVGDHGFYNFTSTISPNTLFKQKGWIALEDNTLKSWRVIAHTSGGQAAIYVKDHKMDSEVMELLKANAGDAYRIIPKNVLNEKGSYPDAICALSAVEGYTFNGKSDGPLITKSDKVRGQHGYFPDDPKLETGFIAVGPGISPNTSLGHIRILDVGPTIASKMGLEIPKADGKAISLEK